MIFRFAVFIGFVAVLLGQQQPPAIAVNWDKTTFVSRTTPTLQVVVNPPLRRGSAIHDRAFAELRDLRADYVRFVPWLPYPRLGVAELEAPAAGKTSWDFQVIDPLVDDFMQAAVGHSVILNFSTIPEWMFTTPAAVDFPKDPDEVTWNYEQGTELRDPTGKELGDYYARLIGWYTAGGFIDENGKKHDSGHHYKVDYWEILNEPDFEHETTPEQYTARYDAIAGAIRAVAPQMKFVGLALADPGKAPRFFEYFLDPKHHRAGIPLDMISYHFYATPTAGQTPEVWQYTFWDQADRFMNVVYYIEAIRKRLAPATRTTIDEIGSILPGDNSWNAEQSAQIPSSYWNLSGALYAWLFGNLSALGIDVLGESQLVGYPTQFPSVSMVDWNTGAANARLRVLKLLRENFGPGDHLVETKGGNEDVYVQGFLTGSAKRRLLIVNRRLRPAEVALPVAGAQVEMVDTDSGAGEPISRTLQAQKLSLGGFAVAVVTLPAH